MTQLFFPGFFIMTHYNRICPFPLVLIKYRRKNIGKYLLDYAPELNQKFEYIELVGELLTPEIHKEIERLYPEACVVNMYGMQEFNGIMYEQDGLMKSIASNVYIEILNQEGQDCAIEEEGDIVISGLRNSAFPLVRYNTGDRAKFTIKNGKKGYIITSGRSNDMFIYKDKQYDGAIFFNVINEYNNTHNRQITRFQIVFRDDMLIYKVLCNIPVDNKHLAQELRSILVRLYDIDINTTTETIDESHNIILGTNKIKYFINDNS